LLGREVFTAVQILCRQSEKPTSPRATRGSILVEYPPPATTIDDMTTTLLLHQLSTRGIRQPLPNETDIDNLRTFMPHARLRTAQRARRTRRRRHERTHEATLDTHRNHRLHTVTRETARITTRESPRAPTRRVVRRPPRRAHAPAASRADGRLSPPELRPHQYVAVGEDPGLRRARAAS
jgi:hypothetical protein